MKTSIALGLLITAVSAPVFATDTATPPAGGHEHLEMGDMGMKGKMGERMKNRMDARMDKMWEEMDANSDGTVTKEESEAFNKKKFDARDANKDGKITREEWDAYGEAKRKEMMEKMKEKREEGVRKTATPPAEPKK